MFREHLMVELYIATTDVNDHHERFSYFAAPKLITFPTS